MNRMWLAAAAALVCADGAFAVEASPQELERNWYRRAAEAEQAVGLAAAEAFKRIDLR